MGIEEVKHHIREEAKEKAKLLMNDADAEVKRIQHATAQQLKDYKEQQKSYAEHVVDASRKKELAACLRCFLKKSSQLDTCETAGVLNTITHLISSIQINEALKILLKKSNFETKLLFFDVWNNELLKIKVNKNKNCICCVKNNFEYLSGKKSSRLIKMCGSNIFQIKAKFFDKKNFAKLKNKLKKIGKIVDFAYCFNFNGKITIFQDGRALIKAKDEKEAKSLYSKFVGN